MGLNKAVTEKLAVAQRKMERLILGIIPFVIESERPGFDKKLV